jgi:hypothetical protein
MLTHGFHAPEELERLRTRHAAGAESEPAPSRTPNPAVQENVAGLEARLSATQADVTALRTQVAELQAAVAALTQQVKDLKGVLDSLM